MSSKSGPPAPEPEEVAPGAPAWIVSFADMALLLLSFFILLLAVSSQKTATDDDILKVLASIKVGFGYTPKDDNPQDDLDLAVLQVLAMKKRGPLKSQLLWTSPAIEGKSMRDKDLWVRVKGAVGKPIIFDPNSDIVPLSWQSTLDEIATVVRHHYRLIVIQGHCSPEEAARDLDGGHGLAFRRALALKAAIEDRGIASARIRLVSCASHDRAKETSSRIQSRAVITLGTYYLPGGEQALENSPHLREE